MLTRYYVYMRCYLWGNWEKGTGDLSELFSQLLFQVLKLFK